MNTNPALLRTALRANAVLSILTGLLLAIAPATVGDWLGVEVDGWLRLLGLGLLGHAIALGVAATQANVRRWGHINLVLIAPYPALLIIVMLAGLVSTGTGRALLAADAAAVGTIAIAHRFGLRAVAPAAA